MRTASGGSRKTPSCSAEAGHGQGNLAVIVALLAKPGLIAAGLLAFLEAWSEFFYALVLTDSLTAPPVVSGLQSLQQFSWTTLAAATVVTVIPPVLIAIGFQRYIVSGLASGSVK